MKIDVSSSQERRALARLKALLASPGLIHGSLQEISRRCGKPTCRCVRGDLHKAHVVSVVVDGKQRSVYVPEAWVERVREWTGRDRGIRSLLLELSDYTLRRLRQRKEG